MAALTKAQKVELCQALAQFWESKQIKEHFRKTHEIELTDRQLSYYRHESEEWKELTKALRERFLDGITEVAIAHKRVRLQVMQDRIPGAALKDVVKAVRQAQLEVEGNKVKVTGHDDGPVVFKLEDIDDATRAALRAIADAVLQQSRDRADGKPD